MTTQSYQHKALPSRRGPQPIEKYYRLMIGKINREKFCQNGGGAYHPWSDPGAYPKPGRAVSKVLDRVMVWLLMQLNRFLFAYFWEGGGSFNCIQNYLCTILRHNFVLNNCHTLLIIGGGLSLALIRKMPKMVTNQNKDGDRSRWECCQILIKMATNPHE